MNRFLNAFSGVFAIVFLIPSFLIMVSWSAIPGDFAYGLKTGLEDVLLAVVSGTGFAPEVSAAYTERRFTEAVKLLDKKGSTVGYTLLIKEAKQTQNLIIEKSDSESAQELITKIDGYQKSIEKKKAAIKSGTDSVPIASTTSITTTTTVSPTTIQAPTVSPTEPDEIVVEAASSEEEIIEDLEETQEELEEIQEELEEEIEEGAFGTFNEQFAPESESRPGRGDDHNNRDNEKGRGKDKD